MAARILRYGGFVVMTSFGLLASVFVAGYALDDPGGAAGIALVVSWAVPMVGLGVFALLQPDRAAPVLVALTVAVLVFAIVDAAFGIVPSDEVGPAVPVAVLALAVAVGCLGLHRPGLASRLLLGTVAVVVLTFGLAIALFETGMRPPGPGPGIGSSVVLALPMLLAGVLFTLAGNGRTDRPLPARHAAGPGGEVASRGQAESDWASAAERPASSRATGTRNGEQET